MVDDAELDRLMREGLELRAADVDVAAPVAREATAAVRRRHRGWLAAGFAAAAVAAIVATIAVSSTPPEPEVSDVQPADEVPDQWRTEYWSDMRVDVPTDWGYGWAPVRSFDRSCLPGATWDANGDSLDADDLPSGYVGRPLGGRDVFSCLRDSDRSEASLLPYVWLGTELDAGRIDLGDGFVQETVEVNGSMLTVGSDDPDLRERIIDSASGGELCLSEIEYAGGIMHDAAAEGATPTSMNVCVYRSLAPEGRPVATLVVADQVGTDEVAGYLRERDLAPTPTDLCPAIDYEEYAWVVLELTTDDGSVTDQDVVHVGPCPGIAIGPQHLSGLERVPLTPGLMRPWLNGGVRAVDSQVGLGLAR